MQPEVYICKEKSNMNYLDFTLMFVYHKEDPKEAPGEFFRKKGEGYELIWRESAVL